MVVVVVVFPAYAGMFLGGLLPCVIYGGFPRIRGDVPSERCFGGRVMGFSPHTRGCSCRGSVLPRQDQVFPAYAGMFPYAMKNWFELERFPRIRGDVPDEYFTIPP